MIDQLDNIDKRLDRIEQKLDNHLERVSKAEEAISSVRGYIRVIITVLLAAMSAAVKYITSVGGH